MSAMEGSAEKVAEKSTKPLGMRKNGKQWHAPKKAFRPTRGLSSYEQRTKERAAMAQMKAKEKEMKEEKEEERQVCGDLFFDKKPSLPSTHFTHNVRSAEFKQSKTSEQERKRRNDTRRWPKRCTASEWSD